jgi:hypothetical protein
MDCICGCSNIYASNLYDIYICKNCFYKLNIQGLSIISKSSIVFIDFNNKIISEFEYIEDAINFYIENKFKIKNCYYGYITYSLNDLLKIKKLYYSCIG